MKHLKRTVHPSIDTLENKSIEKRLATRAIALKGSKLLMLYTERYDDYSLPGGGVDEGESMELGLIRELKEETGAMNIKNIRPFGIYEEFRPWYKENFDLQHIVSYCYTCELDEELGNTALEPYEKSNGMKPIWIEIKDAITHNESAMLNPNKKGMSIERETFLLKLILNTL